METKIKGLDHISFEDFFDKEFLSSATYKNYIMLPSINDGLVNSQRKIIYYVLKNKIKSDVKVARLSQKISEETEYLHGSLDDVVVNLARDYTGTNNISLLSPEGNFGNRIEPEAGAPRYIFTYGKDELFALHNESDFMVYDYNIFDNHEIEPSHLYPILPMIFVNGSFGIGSGFKNTILPNNPKEIISYLKRRLKGTLGNNRKYDLLPYCRGFKGKIEKLSENKYRFYGVFERKRSTVIITEIPIGISDAQYTKKLIALEDEGIIQGFVNKTEDTFLYEVKIKGLSNYSDDEVYEMLGLREDITEFYSAFDDDYRLQVYKDKNEIFEEYYDNRIKFIEKRKNVILKKWKEEIRVLVSKYAFLKDVISKKIDISNLSNKEIIKKIEENPKIIKINDSYNYLLSMQISSMTPEKMKELREKVFTLKEKYDTLLNKKPEDIWLSEIENFEKI